MAESPGPTRPAPGPARWQVPDVDAAALGLARDVRQSIAVLRAARRPRWLSFLEPLAEPLEDGDLGVIRSAANRVRSAFGVGESVAEDLPAHEGRALRDGADAVLRVLDRYEARARHDIARRAR